VSLDHVLSFVTWIMVMQVVVPTMCDLLLRRFGDGHNLSPLYVPSMMDDQELLLEFEHTTLHAS
jgi:hypothetical protein